MEVSYPREFTGECFLLDLVTIDEVEVGFGYRVPHRLFCQREVNAHRPPDVVRSVRRHILPVIQHRSIITARTDHNIAIRDLDAKQGTGRKSLVKVNIVLPVLHVRLRRDIEGHIKVVLADGLERHKIRLRSPPGRKIPDGDGTSSLVSIPDPYANLADGLATEVRPGLVFEDSVTIEVNRASVCCVYKVGTFKTVEPVNGRGRRNNLRDGVGGEIRPAYDNCFSHITMLKGL